MDDIEKQNELICLKELTEELVNYATREVASGGEPLPRMTRALMLASLKIYVAQHGEAATAEWCRQLADAIEADGVAQ